MESFFRDCLDRWTSVTGQPWSDLPYASTPFLDEDVLRKENNIGPGAGSLGGRDLRMKEGQGAECTKL